MRDQRDTEEILNELTYEQVETLKNLTLQDGEFRVSLAKAMVADPACVEVFIKELMAAMHEAVGKFAVKKVLQVGWALLLGVLAWLAAKGYIKVRLP